MRAIILAAGMGKRMQHLTQKCPKGMIKLLGKPLLNRQIDALKKENISDIVLVGGYCAENLKKLGLPIVVNNRYKQTNMVFTLFCAKGYMEQGIDLIISYGDIVYETRVLKALLACKAPISVVVDRAWRAYWELRMDNPLVDAETLKLVDSNRIIELGKKALRYEDIQGQYIGLIKVSGSYIGAFQEAWNNIDQNLKYDGESFEQMYMTSFINYLIELNWEVRAAFTHNGWLEVDTLSDLSLYERLHREDKLKYYYQI